MRSLTKLLKNNFGVRRTHLFIQMDPITPTDITIISLPETSHPTNKSWM